MRRPWWQFPLIVLVGLAAVGGPILFQAWRNAIERNRERQVGDAEPFRIAGNFYYVGTAAASVFLIAGPDGHVLLNSAYPPAVIAAVEKLGFSIRDVKALMTSDEHETADGMAELQQASGAQLWTNDASATVIAAGGTDPGFRFPMSVANTLGAMRYAPPRVDHRIRDGETIRVGPIGVTAHFTPGRSQGCTSWSFAVRDGDRTLNVVSVSPLSRAGGIRYPQQDADLERSVGVLRSLPADIWVTSQSRDWGRYRKYSDSLTSKDPVRPFIDPGGYHAFIDIAEGELRNGITR